MRMTQDGVPFRLPALLGGGLPWHTEQDHLTGHGKSALMALRADFSLGGGLRHMSSTSARSSSTLLSRSRSQVKTIIQLMGFVCGHPEGKASIGCGERREPHGS